MNDESQSKMSVFIKSEADLQNIIMQISKRIGQSMEGKIDGIEMSKATIDAEILRIKQLLQPAYDEYLKQLDIILE